MIGKLDEAPTPSQFVNESTTEDDLGDLLVAVAVASEGLQPRTLRLLSGGAKIAARRVDSIQSLVEINLAHPMQLAY